jgi:hypothetical protein
MTGLTDVEFMALLPPVERALVVYRQDRTMAGQPRTSRRECSYANGPRPTLADTRLFMLTYVQQQPIQAVQGQLVGMSQAHANPWRHRLPPVWKHALAGPAWLPSRTADDLTAMVTTPTREAAAPASLGFMRGRNAPSRVRKTQRSRKKLRVERREATRANTSS